MNPYVPMFNQQFTLKRFHSKVIVMIEILIYFA